MPTLPHRLYRRIRPILYDLGALHILRRLIPVRHRQAMAIQLGLAGFNIAAASGSRLPHGRLRARRAGTQRQNVPRRTDAVNLVGDLRGDSGLSEVTRQTVAAMQAASIKVAYTELIYGPLSRTNPTLAGLLSGAPFDFSLVDVHFSQFYDRLMEAPQEILNSRYVIAYWAWELPKFPPFARANFKLIDEVWVYSHYVQDSLSQSSPVPVVRMPPAIRVSPSPALQRSEFGLPDDRFIFMFSFSPASMAARKNPFGLLSAFERAFGRTRSGPLLVVKTHHLSSILDPTGLGRDLEAAVQAVNGVLIHDNLSRQKMTDLLASCDCYVSLHRAEGFGLGMAEAMALGKPVIATGYSGNMDFMTPSNSWPVRYSLREIVADDHRYQPEFASSFEVGQLWAEPDIAHAAELMQHVFEHPDDAQHIGGAAADHIRRYHSPEAVGARIAARLRSITDG